MPPSPTPNAVVYHRALSMQYYLSVVLRHIAPNTSSIIIL